MRKRNLKASLWRKRDSVRPYLRRRALRVEPLQAADPLGLDRPFGVGSTLWARPSALLCPLRSALSLELGTFRKPTAAPNKCLSKLNSKAIRDSRSSVDNKTGMNLWRKSSRVSSNERFHSLLVKDQLCFSATWNRRGCSWDRGRCFFYGGRRSKAIVP